MDSRIKFYGVKDYSTFMQFEAINTLLKSFDASNCAFNDVNSVLELVNLLKYMNDSDFRGILSEEAIGLFETKRNSIYSGVKYYFEHLDCTSLAMALKDVDYSYLVDFLDEFAMASLKNISEEDFKNAWLGSGKHTIFLFKNKKIVDTYISFCKGIFLGDSSNIEILLDNYISGSSAPNIIPATIDSDEMYRLCVDYVKSDRANPKYLGLILRASREIKSYLTVDADLQVTIKRRRDEIESELIKKNGIITHSGFAVYSKKLAYEKAKQNKDTNDTVLLIDGDWLDYDCSSPTILNNLRHVYGLFTLDAISMLPSFPNMEMGLSDIFGELDTKNAYKKGEVFGNKQNISFCELQMLNRLLSERHTSLLNIIEWFYNEYCRKEFGIKWLNLPVPVENEKIGNKTATLFRAEENIRKQYYVYCKKNEIDRDFVDCLSTPDFYELLSFDGRMKYAYFSEKSILKKYAGFLFSTQSGLGIARTGEAKGSLYKLLEEGNLFINDFYDYQQPQIRTLLDNGILREYDNGLGLGNLSMLKMLYQLFYIGTICLWYLDKDSRNLVDEWEKGESITYGNTLFSELEIDYLNYMLNNSSFDNSLALRNKYQHGFDSSDDTELQFDYCMALLVHILYMIKLNDEFVFRLPDVDREKFDCSFVDGF